MLENDLNGMIGSRYSKTDYISQKQNAKFHSAMYKTDNLSIAKRQNHSKMTADEFSEHDIMQDDHHTNSDKHDTLVDYGQDDNERVQAMIKKEKEKNNKLLNELHNII